MVEFEPSWAELGQMSAETDRVWATRPSPTCPNSPEMVQIKQTSAESDETGQTRADFGRARAKLGQNRPSLGETGQMLTEVLPSSAEVAHIWSVLGESWSKPAKSKTGSLKKRPVGLRDAGLRRNGPPIPTPSEPLRPSLCELPG